MSKLDLADITTLANATSAIQTMNSNNQKLEDAINDCISRDGTAPNMMEADLDLNSHRLLNVADPVYDSDGCNYGNLKSLIDGYAGEIVANATFANWTVEQFTATAGQTNFTLVSAPASLASMDVVVDGVTKLAGVDYNIDGNLLFFTSGLTVGQKVQVRYGNVLPIGATSADLVEFTQGGTGAVPRDVEDKLHEFVTPEDFGALGIGELHQVSEWLIGGVRDRGFADLAAIQAVYPHVTSLTDEIDYAALQAAINYCQSGLRVLTLRGRYWINKGLVIGAPMWIRGAGWSGTQSIIVAKAAMTAMVQIKSGTMADDMRGGGISGVQFSCSALAQHGILANTVSWWRFDQIRIYGPTVAGIKIDDTNGGISQRNNIDNYYFYANVAGSEPAHGLWLDGGGGNGGCVQTKVGSVYLNHKNGDGLRIGYCDNNIFDSVGDFTQSGGTGRAIRFMAQGASGARNNYVGHCFGKIYAEAGTYGNRLQRVISETTYITIESGAFLDYVASDYVSADVFQTHRYRMTDQLHLPLMSFMPIGSGASLITSKTYWAAGALSKSAVGSLACSFSPYDWNDGTVTGLRLRISNNTVESGKNARLTIRMSEKQAGETVSFVEKTQLFTVAMPNDDNLISEVDLDFITPMDVRKDCAIFLNIERTIGDAGDTAAGAMIIHAINVKHQSYGPNYFNNTDRFDVSPPYKS